MKTNGTLLILDNGREVLIPHNNTFSGVEEAKRLASLFAAAPEMLESLKRGLAALRANGAPNCEAAKEMMAAVAKAEREIV